MEENENNGISTLDQDQDQGQEQEQTQDQVQDQAQDHVQDQTQIAPEPLEATDLQQVVETDDATIAEPIDSTNSVDQADATSPTGPANSDASATASDTTTNDSFAPASEQSGASPEPSKKKSKVPLIISVASGIALLGAGGGFTAAYMIQNQPEAVAMQVASNLINAKNLNLSGTINLMGIKSLSIGEFEVTGVHLKLDEATNADFNTSNSATITIDIEDEDPLQIKLGSVVLSDGTLYIKLAELEDALNLALNTASDMMAEFKEEYNDFYTTVEDFVKDLVGEVDGKWWKIDIAEVVDKIDDIDSKTKKSVTEAYSCVFNVMSDEFKNRDKYMDLYKDNAFMEIAEYDGNSAKTIKDLGTLYSLKIDSKKLSGFVEKSKDKELTNKIGKCLEGITDVSQLPEDIDYGDLLDDIDEDDYEYYSTSSLDSLNIPEIIIAVDGFFDHKLTGLYIEHDVAGAKLDATLKFNYDAKNIQAPQDAKNITELVDFVMDGVEDIMEVYQKYAYGSYGYADDDALGTIVDQYV